MSRFDDDDRYGDVADGWQRLSGIFVISDLRGPACEHVMALQRRFDPKLANSVAPHITLAGSSGVGPIHADTRVEELRRALEPIAASTPPLELKLGRPVRFMQREIVVLPLDPHGPLRELHERIRASGLRFHPARHAFTPHVTISFYPELTRERLRELLAVRVEEPLVIDHIRCSLSHDSQRPKLILELPLGRGESGVGTGDWGLGNSPPSRVPDR